eukprot:scaffold70645_cov96-Phaeocystis_antarctica.AAC.1
MRRPISRIQRCRLARTTLSRTRLQLRYAPKVSGTPTLGLYQPRALCAVASHLLLYQGPVD